jgi:hypothetical protein
MHHQMQQLGYLGLKRLRLGGGINGCHVEFSMGMGRRKRRYSALGWEIKLCVRGGSFRSVPP